MAHSITGGSANAARERRSASPCVANELKAVARASAVIRCLDRQLRFREQSGDETLPLGDPLDLDRDRIHPDFERSTRLDSP